MTGNPKGVAGAVAGASLLHAMANHKESSCYWLQIFNELAAMQRRLFIQPQMIRRSSITHAVSLSYLHCPRHQPTPIPEYSYARIRSIAMFYSPTRALPLAHSRASTRSLRSLPLALSTRTLSLAHSLGFHSRGNKVGYKAIYGLILFPSYLISARVENKRVSSLTRTLPLAHSHAPTRSLARSHSLTRSFSTRAEIR